MSVLVYLIAKNKTIDIEQYEKELSAHFNEAFGFETCREKLWGLEVIKKLGCKMIYSLKEKDIYAFDEQVDELERELIIILENRYEIGNLYGVEFIEERVNNALQVIKIAKKYKDKLGVVIG